MNAFPACAGSAARKLALVLASAAAALGSTGCDVDHCPVTDLACFLDHLVVVDATPNANPYPLTNVPLDAIQGRGSAAGPTLSVADASLTIGSPNVLQPLSAAWTDPNGCSPALCFRVCDDTGLCSNGYTCAPSYGVRGATGRWDGYLGFLAAPAGGRMTMTADVVPVTAAGCPTGLVSRIQAGDASLSIGEPVEFGLLLTDD